MDGERFDALTKWFARSRSRRDVLRVGLGGGLAGIAGAVAGHGAAPVAAAIGDICTAEAAAQCVRDATQIFQIQANTCRKLMRRNPNRVAGATFLIGCLANAQQSYDSALSDCQVQSCDTSNCEQCVNGKCQSACAAGVGCFGGRCGCASDQHACGAGCCEADQACCNHGCCQHGITTCNPDGSCGCPSNEKPCNGTCIPTTQCCTDADCPANNVCEGGSCVSGCKGDGETCGGDGECCSGLCAGNVCTAPTTTTTTTTSTTTTSTTTTSTTTSTTTAPPTTTTTTTTTTTAPGCLPSGTQTSCNEFNQGACCSGHCQGFSINGCGGQQAGFLGCCELDGASCTGRSGINPACCGGFCAMNPGQTTGVCQRSELGSGQACGIALDCLSCTCASGTCQ